MGKVKHGNKKRLKGSLSLLCTCVRREGRTKAYGFEAKWK